jgi:aryl-alcohol dehydrogenase-like predicted oxidoreductase
MNPWLLGELETRHLDGGTLPVSVVGLGCNNFGRRLDANSSIRVVHAALDEGITFFDTADVYREGQSEVMLGTALQGRRDAVVIATKFGYPTDDPERCGASRRWIRVAVEDSLRRLGTDRIDLYQMHAPDSQTPIEETLEALTELVGEGKIRCAGSSNLSGWQIADADWTSGVNGLTRFVSAQNGYSLVDRAAEEEVIPACERFKVGFIPYLPLAGGLLTGKHHRGQGAAPGSRLERVPDLGDRLLIDRNFDVVEALERFGRERDLSLVDVAIGGLAAQPQVVSVIAGAMSPEQVRANARAGRWRPSPADLELLNRLAPRR